MRKFYIANALILSDDTLVFCGLYNERLNAYKGIEAIMNTAGTAEYVPQVRVAEVLDDEDSDFFQPE